MNIKVTDGSDEGDDVLVETSKASYHSGYVRGEIPLAIVASIKASTAYLAKNNNEKMPLVEDFFDNIDFTEISEELLKTFFKDHLGLHLFKRNTNYYAKNNSLRLNQDNKKVNILKKMISVSDSNRRTTFILSKDLFRKKLGSNTLFSSEFLKAL